MIFQAWVIFNLIFTRFGEASFVAGSSSSISVLPTTLFPTEAAANLPFSGTISVVPDCGWITVAAGSTAPGYYTAAVFGTFNVGSGNTGQANVGYNNTGFGNYGYSNTGRMNTGSQNTGYLNNGNNNTGAYNYGNGHIGDGNTSATVSEDGALFCIGYNNTDCTAVIGSLTNESEYSIGSSLEGNFLFGFDLTGDSQIGQDNEGANNVGFDQDNTASPVVGSIGVLNVGDALVGYNNTGNFTIGQNNTGAYQIGLTNVGAFQIGVNNTLEGSTLPSTLTDLNIGIDQIGYTDIGVQNDGNDLTGFDLIGSSQIGGTYIDTSSVALSAPIVFDIPEVEENIGSSYNSIVTQSTDPLYPFIQEISTVWQFNLDIPGLLSVVDLGCAGDVIQVYDGGVLLMTTTFPSGTNTATLADCAGLNDPEEALADPQYSRNFITLQPGLHSLAFDVSGVSNGTLLAFRVDLVRPPQPCTECTIPVPPLDPLTTPAELFEGLSEFELPRNIFKCTSEKEKKELIEDQAEEVIINEILDDYSTNSASTGVSSAYNTTSSASNGVSSVYNTTNITTNTTTNNNNNNNINHDSLLDWCRGKNFQMLRNGVASFADAVRLCPFGLARPATPAAQLEITSLLFQCTTKTILSPEQISRGQWIGSDWTGLPGDCLFANGENVEMSADCSIPRRFICKR
jgi:hypothetical protein